MSLTLLQNSDSAVIRNQYGDFADSTHRINSSGYPTMVRVIDESQSSPQILGSFSRTAPILNVSSPTLGTRYWIISSEWMATENLPRSVCIRTPNIVNMQLASYKRSRVFQPFVAMMRPQGIPARLCRGLSSIGGGFLLGSLFGFLAAMFGAAVGLLGFIFAEARS
jgi:hypothetical protein